MDDFRLLACFFFRAPALFQLFVCQKKGGKHGSAANRYHCVHRLFFKRLRSRHHIMLRTMLASMAIVLALHAPSTGVSLPPPHVCLCQPTLSFSRICSVPYKPDAHCSCAHALRGASSRHCPHCNVHPNDIRWQAMYSTYSS